jgi:hypothetical protein
MVVDMITSLTSRFIYQSREYISGIVGVVRTMVSDWRIRDTVLSFRLPLTVTPSNVTFPLNGHRPAIIR